MNIGLDQLLVIAVNRAVANPSFNASMSGSGFAAMRNQGFLIQIKET